MLLKQQCLHSHLPIHPLPVRIATRVIVDYGD